MGTFKIPEIGKELFKRIRLVRRDIGNLLFHFTRAPEENFVKAELDSGWKLSMRSSASAVLRKILYEGKLLGTSRWTYGEKCVCFSEAPMHEFNSIFSLVEI